VAEQ
jgi:hypothetical protein